MSWFVVVGSTYKTWKEEGKEQKKRRREGGGGEKVCGGHETNEKVKENISFI